MVIPGGSGGWSWSAVNGDGYSDVIVGANLYDNGESDEGRSCVFMGSAAGLSASPAWTAEGNLANASFGCSVGTAGDVNGDGYADVLVGSWEYDHPEVWEGRALLYLGSAAGPSTTAAWTVESDQAYAKLGHSVATAGDVNGDGYADVIVGAHQYTNGESSEGQARLYLGSAFGLGTSPAWTAEGNQAGANLGVSVACAGDLNGDGYADVIVGARYYDNGEQNEGRAFVYLGSAGGLSGSAAWTAEGDQVNAWFGISAGTAGDVNGDGYSDVLVGARLYDNGEVDEGRAFLYLGSAAGLSPSAGWTAEDDQASAWFGYATSAAGDVNGDGYSDVLVGAPGYDGSEMGEGRAYVYYGNEGAGVGLRPQQLRSDLSAPIAPLGLAFQYQYRIALELHSPFGTGIGRLQWQVVKLRGSLNPGINPIQASPTWTQGEVPVNQLIDVSEYQGPWTWRARVQYHPSTSPFQGHGPWKTMGRNGPRETDLRSTSQAPPPPCEPPDEPVWIYQVTLSVPQGYPILHFQDPNQPSQRTGYNVRRSDDPVSPKSTWPLVATNVVDMDENTPNIQWTDTSGDVPPSGTWYYQVTAYNGNCQEEGPF